MSNEFDFEYSTPAITPPSSSDINPTSIQTPSAPKKEMQTKKSYSSKKVSWEYFNGNVWVSIIDNDIENEYQYYRDTASNFPAWCYKDYTKNFYTFKIKIDNQEYDMRRISVKETPWSSHYFNHISKNTTVESLAYYKAIPVDKYTFIKQLRIFLDHIRNSRKQYINIAYNQAMIDLFNNNMLFIKDKNFCKLKHSMNDKYNVEFANCNLNGEMFVVKNNSKFLNELKSISDQVIF